MRWGRQPTDGEIGEELSAELVRELENEDMEE